MEAELDAKRATEIECMVEITVGDGYEMLGRNSWGWSPFMRIRELFNLDGRRHICGVPMQGPVAPFQPLI